MDKKTISVVFRERDTMSPKINCAKASEIARDDPGKQRGTNFLVKYIRHRNFSMNSDGNVLFLSSSSL